MNYIHHYAAVLAVLFASAPSFAANPAPPLWPQMRGPAGDGHADDDARPPVRWSESSAVAWKTAIPGQGWSTPAVAGDVIWLTTATDDGRSRRAVCVDRLTGAIRHDIELFQVPQPAPKHDFNSYASPSPATDGKHVYCTFGADGTACLDAATGKRIWERRDIIVDHFRGAGSSPILQGDLLFLHFDGIDRQFVMALDAATGTTRWQTERSHVINKDGDFKKAYTTPLIRTLNGRSELLSVAAECIYGYAPETGKELWRCRFDGFSNAVEPVIWRDQILVNTGFGKAKLFALRAGGSGDVTGSHVGWTQLKNIGRMSGPILVNDQLFVVSDEGIGSMLDPATGEVVWRERLGTGLSFAASPIYANGLIYFFDHQKGAGIVIRPGSKMDIIAENQLAAGCMASPIAIGNQLIVRTKSHLYALQDAAQ